MTKEPKHPLTAYREAKDWTLARLAEEIGVKKNTVWRWEKGRLPHESEWAKITAATGIRPSQLAAYKAGEESPRELTQQS